MSDAVGRVAAADPGVFSSRELRRLLPVLAPVVTASFVVMALAGAELARIELTPTRIGGFLAILAAATLAEAFPVPLGGVPVGGVSMAAIFIVGAALLFGWAPAAVLACVASTLVHLRQRHDAAKLVYNGAVYALAAAAAAALVGGHETVASLVAAGFLGSCVFWVINIALVVAAVWRVARQDPLAMLASTMRWTAVPFGIMASTSVMLVALAGQSAFLPLTLVGPLIAITLYQRSVHQSLEAMRLALTDPLTGLSNIRHYSEQLERHLDLAQGPRGPLSLCLFDVDDFKLINDDFGHRAGDAALQRIAAALRHGGEAYRLGGDEFALMLPGRSEAEARAIAAKVVERIAASPFDHRPVEVSVGVATFPHPGLDRDDFVDAADQALYAAKDAGKNQVSCYRPLSVRPPDPHGGPGESSSAPRDSRTEAA